MGITVNQILVLMKAVRERLNSLKSLATQVSTRDIYLYGDNREKTSEPQYDIKEVDKKVVQLEKWLFKADAAIKQANAVTIVDVEADVDVLLDPLT